MAPWGARLCCLLLLTAAARAGDTPDWTPDAFPDPKKDLAACGRDGVPSNLCDPDLVLSKPAKGRIEGIIKEIWNGEDPYVRAQCGDKLEGYQVAVAVMQRMAVPEGESATAQAKVFAKALHDKWGVGDAACNNGVLLLLSVQDRQVYISTGAAAARALSDDDVAGVIDAMRPALRKADFDSAVEAAVVDIGLGLAGRDLAPESSVDWFAVAFFGVVGLLVFNSCRKSWLRRREYRDCKRMLAKLKREQDAVRTHAWSAPASCPICMEDFNPPPTSRHGPGGKGGADAEAGGKGGDEAGPSSSGGGGYYAAAPAGDSATASLLVRGGEGALPGELSGEEGESSARGRGAAACCGGVRRRSVGRGLGEEEAGGAGASGSGAGGEGGSQGERRAMTLGCGHTFCEHCLTRWLENKTTCPICRKSVTNPDGAQQQQGPSDGGLSSADGAEAAVAGQQGGANRVLPDWWMMELAFRLGSLQRMYPTYLTTSMADQWLAEARETGTFNWEATRDFQLRDPTMRNQHESSGSGGFSTSFGGGSSYGGGGGGGSW